MGRPDGRARRTCRSTSRDPSSPSTGGRTARRCCCSSSSPAVIASTATTWAPDPSRRSTRSRARSRRRPCGPTARSGTGPTTGSTPRRSSPSAGRRPIVEAEGAKAPAGRVFEEWWFENPNGQRVPGVHRAPGRRRALSGGDARPRRAAFARHGPLVPGRARPRRRRVPRRDGQLPRIRRVRAGMARRAHGERRLPRARGRARGPRRPDRPRPGRSGAGRPGGLVVGRLRDAAGPRPPPRAVGGGDRGRADRRLHRVLRGRGADPPVARPGPLRRLARVDARAVPRAEPDHLRRRGRRAAADPRRRERLALSDPPGLELRRAAAGPRPRARGLHVLDRSLVVRRGRAGEAVRDRPGLPRPERARRPAGGRPGRLRRRPGAVPAA